MTARGRRATHTLRKAVHAEGGFTLAELLVVVVILAMIMGAVFATLDVSQKVYSRASAAEDVQAGMRAAMDRIVAELRLIGSFYTGAGNAGSPITAFGPTSITFWGDVDADTAATAFAGGNTVVSEATLASAVSAGSSDVTIAPATAGDPGVTGFTAGELIYIADGSIREVRTVTSASGNSAGLSGGVMNAYAAGSLVRSVEQVTYSYTAGSPLGTLSRETAAEGSQTLLDNVVSFALTGFDFAGATTTNPAGIEEVGIDLVTRAGAGVTGSSQRRMTIRVRVRVVPTS
jgi:prepilin-type N-terminal cleavage/methylation domain-containing protein